MALDHMGGYLDLCSRLDYALLLYAGNELEQHLISQGS